jgi:DNA polymerase-3 subunit beta
MSDDQVEVSSSSDQTGSGVERLTTIQYTGERLDIAFNALFVSQAVRALGSEDVRMSFVGEMKPFVIRNPKDDSVVELITPMRTR